MTPEDRNRQGSAAFELLVRELHLTQVLLIERLAHQQALLEALARQTWPNPQVHMERMAEVLERREVLAGDAWRSTHEQRTQWDQAVSRGE